MLGFDNRKRIAGFFKVQSCETPRVIFIPFIWLLTSNMGHVEIVQNAHTQKTSLQSVTALLHNSGECRLLAVPLLCSITTATCCWCLILCFPTPHLCDPLIAYQRKSMFAFSLVHFPHIVLCVCVFTVYTPISAFGLKRQV